MGAVVFRSPEELLRLTPQRGLPAFDPAQLTEQEADLHLCSLSTSGEISARCSLWWRNAPPLEKHKVGAIGHYSSVDGTAAAELIAAAAEHLQAQGRTIAVAPMDGNTWHRYRFVTERGAEPSFFLEPENPSEWPLQFENAGFAPLAQYFSSINTDLSRRDDRVEKVAARLEQSGVRIVATQASDLPSQLTRIYRLSRIAFARNFLYTELSEAAFAAQYAKILPYVRPELVLLAERGGELVGYLFAVPDLAQASRGATVDTFLIKTVAILPEAALRGLGGVLVARAQEIGHRMGFSRCIHALMHESNVSLNISRHYASSMRRYTLYGRELLP